MPYQSHKIYDSHGTQAMRTGSPTQGQHHTVRGIRPVNINLIQRTPMKDSTNLGFLSHLSKRWDHHISCFCVKVRKSLAHVAHKPRGPYFPH